MDKPTLSYSDLKKVYASYKSVPDRKTTLCYSDKKVNIKSLKVKDKKEFLKAMESGDEEVIEKCIDNIIEKYVVLNETGDPLDPNILMEQERQQLMVEIRLASSTIDGVTLTHRCPKCKEKKSNISFGSDNVIVTKFSLPDGVSDILDVAGERIKLRLSHLNRKDNIDVLNYIKDKKIETATDRQYAYLAAAIKDIFVNDSDVSIPVNMKLSEKVEFLESMSIGDLDKIEKYFNSIGDFGIKLQFPFKCDKCDYASEKEEVKVISFFMS